MHEAHALLHVMMRRNASEGPCLANGLAGRTGKFIESHARVCCMLQDRHQQWVAGT